MSKKKENVSFWGFLGFFRKLLGVKLYFYIVFNILVSLLDGLGLAMFIPLIGFATGNSDTTTSLGNLNFIPNMFHSLGINLSLSKTLIFIVIVFSVKSILTYLRQLFFIKLRLKALKDIRYNLIDRLTSLSFLGYSTSDPGTIQFNMVGETGRLVRAMTSYIRVFEHGVILITYILMAIYVNWQFAILVIFGAGISNVIYTKINNETKREAKKISDQGNVFNGYLIQAINNFKYLKATNSFRQYNTKLKGSIRDYEESNFNLGKLNAIAISLREPLIIIVISVMLVFQIKVLHGNVEGILVSLLLFYRGLSHMVNLQNDWNLFLSNSASIQALDNLDKDFRSKSEAQQDEKFEHPHLESIQLQNILVDVNGKKILQDVDLQISQKQTIALVGESGAGKTTLANVIIGLIKPNDGDIVVNNKLLSRNHIDSFRKRIGYITQEPVIFDDSLFNNVTLWDEKNDSSLTKFKQCIDLVHLSEFLQELEKQEETPLGNNGVLISGGQKQRISIARELYRDVDLFIMDEATSALDSETESIIKANIEDLRGKYMMVIIAHRLSTIRNADCIYLMSKGKVIDKGTYSELISKSKQFKKMIELQEI